MPCCLGVGGLREDAIGVDRRPALRIARVARWRTSPPRRLRYNRGAPGAAPAGRLPAPRALPARSSKVGLAPGAGCLIVIFKMTVSSGSVASASSAGARPREAAGSGAGSAGSGSDGAGVAIGPSAACPAPFRRRSGRLLIRPGGLPAALPVPTGLQPWRHPAVFFLAPGATSVPADVAGAGSASSRRAARSLRWIWNAWSCGTVLFRIGMVFPSVRRHSSAQFA